MKKTFLFILVALLASCVKDTDPSLSHFQLLKEKEKVTVGTDRVSIEGQFSFEGKVEAMSLRLSKNAHLHGSDDYPVTVSGQTFSVMIDSLEPGFLYYYQYLVDYGASTVFLTEIDSFRTLAVQAMVETLEVLPLDSTSFRVKARVLGDGGDPVTERGVCWNDYGDPTVEDHRVSHEEGGLGEYTCKLLGLPPFTTCYARAYARNGMGVSYGAVLSFSTGIEVNLPIVHTLEVTGVAISAAVCLCTVHEDGGAEVFERGVCWSTHPNPDITSWVYANGNGLGEYQVDMVNLEPNTTYYVRAYAKNSKGIGYGEVLNFTTEEELEPPLGAINGLFTVGENKQVWFSQGNLIYQASDHYWGFHGSQYEFIGDDNSNISAQYSGWIDLFGWGTSGYEHGAVCYQPWSITEQADLYWAYGSETCNLFDQTGQADWGYGVDLEEEGAQSHSWRTLTVEEWGYLFQERNTSSGIRYAKANVEGVNGVILLPDAWSTSFFNLNNVNQSQASFLSNSLLGWEFDAYLEPNGAVFLPAAGFRRGTVVIDAGLSGHYWSSSVRSGKKAYILYFNTDFLETDNTGSRYYGSSVRLVWDIIR